MADLQLMAYAESDDQGERVENSWTCCMYYRNGLVPVGVAAYIAYADSSKRKGFRMDRKINRIIPKPISALLSCLYWLSM